jgi:hypothetical protein
MVGNRFVSTLATYRRVEILASKRNGGLLCLSGSRLVVG